MENLNFSESTAHPLALYRNHLEFNGYRISEDASEAAILFCRHPRKPNLILKPIAERGVLISTIYTFEPGIPRLEMLEYINQLNGAFIFMKAYVDQVNDLVIETFFEGDYDRTNFSILLENIDYDMGILRRNELTLEYLR